MTSRALAIAIAAMTFAGCSTGDPAGSGPDTSSPDTSSLDASSLDTASPDATVDTSTGTTSTVPIDTTTDVPTTADATVTIDTSGPGTASDAGSTASAGSARLDEAVEAALDADGYGELLSSLHATIVDPTAPTRARADAGARFQLVLRSLADRPELDDAVLAALRPSARPSVERIVRAREFLQARSASRPSPPPPTEVPAWTIIEPEPVPTLLGHYAEAEARTGIPWYWLAAIHLQETRMGRIQGVSSAGAVGPMQFLPTTWEVCCEGDPTMTRDAIIGAATYLAQSGGPDDMAAALYRYNPNDGYVAVVTAYAEALRDEPELYSGYHGFQVFYGTSAGTVRLPIGYAEPEPVDAASYLAANPADAAS